MRPIYRETGAVQWARAVQRQRRGERGEVKSMKPRPDGSVKGTSTTSTVIVAVYMAVRRGEATANIGQSISLRRPRVNSSDRRILLYVNAGHVCEEQRPELRISTD